MSAQVIDILPNDQLELKKSYKRRISEVSNGRGRRRGRGRGRFLCGAGGGGQEVRGGSGREVQDDSSVAFNTFNGIEIRDLTREISAQYWENLGWYGRAYVSKLRN